jgi:hypothetical protein
MIDTSCKVLHKAFDLDEGFLAIFASRRNAIVKRRQACNINIMNNMQAGSISLRYEGQR